MNYLTLFEGKALFNKLWPLSDLGAELDLRLTMLIVLPVPLHLWHVLVLSVLGTSTSLTSSLKGWAASSSISQGRGGGNPDAELGAE